MLSSLLPLSLTMVSILPLHLSGSMQFLMGPGQGMVSFTVRVIGSTVLSNTIPYWYTPGTARIVSPVSGESAGGTVVIVNGTNLGRALSVTTSIGCNAVNRVWIGPWLCDVLEVGAHS
jgi:hypothetical protein